MKSLKIKRSAISENKRKSETALEDVEMEIRRRIAKKMQFEKEGGKRLEDHQNALRRQQAVVAKTIEAVRCQAKDVEEREGRINETRVKLKQHETELENLQVGKRKTRFNRQALVVVWVVRQALFL